jgi:cytochrome P450
MNRIALKDFKFFDGTVLPAGTFISVPLYATLHDESTYSNPFKFDPNRFLSSNNHGSDGTRTQMVTSSMDYLSWGLGKHAWCVLFIWIKMRVHASSTARVGGWQPLN